MSTEPVTSCQCAVCTHSREVRNRIELLPKEHQEFFTNLFDLYLDTSYDLDYYKAKAKGQI